MCLKQDKIVIRGARVHNLQDISLEIPHNKLTVMTGVSGSGKSSLAFDTIFAEGQRRYIESLSPYARQFLGQMKPADVDEIIGLAPAISIDQKALSHNPRSTVGTLTEIYDYLRVLYARLGEVYCPECGRRIAKMSVEEMVDLIIAKSEDQKVSPSAAGRHVKILSPVVIDRKGEYYQILYDYLALGYSEARIDGEYLSLRDKIVLARHKKHSIDIVIDKVMVSDDSRLFEAVENALDYSKGLAIAIFDKEETLLSANWTCPVDGTSFPEVEPRLFSFNSPHGACEECHGLGRKEKWLLKSDIEGKDDQEDESTNKYERVVEHCLVCDGKRLNKFALSVLIGKKNIAEVCALPLDRAHRFFSEYYNKMTDREKTIAEAIVFEISSRLDFLLKVGLNYLTLDREAETLSGGEAQRIRLSSQIGSHLSHTLYVLDEPTIGLHERDTDRLIETLKSLRDQNNTVIVVEHDERTIMASDYLVDLGPLAGRHGGKVMAIGQTDKLLKGAEYPDSLTLQYLRQEKEINLDRARRTKEAEAVRLIGATANNLKNINVDFPLRKLVVVTGVSGSGKSTLLFDALYENLIKVKHGFRKDLNGIAKLIGSEYLNKVVIVNQSPIGRTPRSNPATYTGIFTPIRDFYASLPASAERGYGIGRFSFNRPGGRCEACDGAGFNLIEMHFLPAVLVECDVCHGKRFNRETLQIKYKNKNIADVLSLTIDEAVPFFDGQYLITDKLKVLQEVGLGYLQLGQSATTLSGGEAQRIKLARELTHTLGQKTLYLLDEPSVGLHYHDIEMLLLTLNKLIDRGNSVILIEHNMHIIKEADHVIDLGPGGGESGGKVIAHGTPHEITRAKESLTGDYLRTYLK